MRQMTMTQLFDPVESPKSRTASPPVKQEPNTPPDNSMLFMPESLIGLAQPSESMSDTENNQVKLFVRFHSFTINHLRILFPIQCRRFRNLKHPKNNH